MIDYKGLAGRIKCLADYTESDPAWDAAETADLRTVVSLLEGMAEAKPVGWLHRVYLGDDLVDKAMLDTADPAQVPLGPNEVVRTVVPLFLRPAPQPQPERQPVSEPTRWKVGNELAPYHPDASHVEPGYRDGWNACYRAMRESEPTEAQIEASQAALDVLAERRRQVEAEGWTPAHDDKHIGGQMAMAAACYAAHAAVDECIHCTSEDTLPSLAVLLARAQGFVAQCWPWSHRWWKPSDRRRNLVKAGALILAEIERLDRAALAARDAT